jgi:hypothetical protein
MSILWFLYSLWVLAAAGAGIYGTVKVPGLHAMPMYIADAFSVLSGIFLLVTSITEKYLGYAIIIHVLPAAAAAILSFTEPETPPTPDSKNKTPVPASFQNYLLVLRAIGLFIPLLTLYWGFQRVEMEQAAAASVILGGRRRKLPRK